MDFITFLGIMKTILLALVLFIAVIQPTEAHLTPANTRDPYLITQDQTEELLHNLALVETLPDPSIYSKDVFYKIFETSHLESFHDNKINASECAYGVTDFINGLVLRKKYALRMVDSWGKIGSGLATGNLKWMGRYYECIDVHRTNYSGRYFAVALGKQAQDSMFGGSTSISFGLCLPDTCSSKQANELLAPIGNITEKKLNATYMDQPTTYRPLDIISIIITCILGIFVIAATIYDLFLTAQKKKGLTYETLSPSYIDASTNGINHGQSMAARLLLSFSIIKNTRAIFDTSSKEGNIGVLHGMRFISMTWVILGHTFIFGPNYVDNQLDAAEYYLDTWQFQAVGNATFSVDSFFFLSGLLVAYLGMREMAKRSGKLTVGLPYLYRYLRLTPAYAFCILISVSLYTKFGDGPIWPGGSESFRTPCEKYWWTNLLYINNLYPFTLGDECFGWGWYLANDTQFFLLSPFILAILFRSPIGGNILLAIGALISIAVTGGVSSHYKLQPMPLQIGLLYSYVIRLLDGEKVTLTDQNYERDVNVTTAISTTTGYTPPDDPSKSDQFWSDTYAKPWCRMGVYFIGMITGYILYKTKLRVRMGKIVATIGWIIASATAVALIYGLYGSIDRAAPLGIGVASFYNAVSRPLWSVCLAWVVIACCSGYGGPVNNFLSWKPFIPLSRLTYCAYLVHPLVIFWAYNNLETLIHFSIIEITLHFLGFLAIAYAVAFVVSVLVEMPMIGIIKALTGKSSPKQTPINSQPPINQLDAPQDHSDA